MGKRAQFLFIQLSILEPAGSGSAEGGAAPAALSQKSPLQPPLPKPCHISQTHQVPLEIVQAVTFLQTEFVSSHQHQTVRLCHHDDRTGRV